MTEKDEFCRHHHSDCHNHQPQHHTDSSYETSTGNALTNARSSSLEGETCCISPALSSSQLKRQQQHLAAAVHDHLSCTKLISHFDKGDHRYRPRPTSAGNESDSSATAATAAAEGADSRQVGCSDESMTCQSRPDRPQARNKQIRRRRTESEQEQIALMMMLVNQQSQQPLTATSLNLESVETSVELELESIETCIISQDHSSIYNASDLYFDAHPYSAQLQQPQPPHLAQSSSLVEKSPELDCLKDLVLVQLDLIQHQQEQLLKKDRQMQGLLHDRELLFATIAKLEQQLKSACQQTVKPKRCFTVQSISYHCNLSTAEKRASTAGGPHSLLSPKKARKRPAAATTNRSPQPNAAEVASKDKAAQAEDDVHLVQKKKSSAKRRKKPPPVTADLDAAAGQKPTTCITTEDATSERQQQQRNAADAESGHTQSPIRLMETECAYEIITNQLGSSDEDEADERFDPDQPTPASCGQPNGVSIEIPSWRIHPISSCYSLEGTENLNDEEFNRRHAKPEMDEKRRKRWHMQRVREQSMIERLRSGRYHGTSQITSNFQASSAGNASSSKQQLQHTSSAAAEHGQSSTASSTSSVSFYPPPKDIQYIEICDTLPVIAFGHPIPMLEQKPFTLPWNRSRCGQTPKK